MRYLLTGGAGFIGHHVADCLLNRGDEVVILDRLDCSGNLNRMPYIRDWELVKTRCKWVHHDLRAPLHEMLIKQIGHIDVILHLAAATHIDRSITDPVAFVLDNVVGTAHLLEYARKLPDLLQFLHFSTDEVFGPATGSQSFKEDDRYNSGNPYSASKAGAEQLVLSYWKTYDLPVKVLRCMNVFGERQHPEKFIPSTISKMRRGEGLMIFTVGPNRIVGSRIYLHTQTVVEALMFILAYGYLGESYNVVGDEEIDNIALAERIGKIMGVSWDYRLSSSARPGYDVRYAMDGSKLRDLGWRATQLFEPLLERTINWSLQHPEWLL